MYNTSIKQIEAINWYRMKNILAICVIEYHYYSNTETILLLKNTENINN